MNRMSSTNKRQCAKFTKRRIDPNSVRPERRRLLNHIKLLEQQEERALKALNDKSLTIQILRERGDNETGSVRRKGRFYRMTNREHTS